MISIKLILKVILPFVFQSEKIIFWHSVGFYLFNRGFLKLALVVEGMILRFYNCSISSQAKIGKGVKLVHPIGVTIGAGVKIGNNVLIYQNVTLGGKGKPYLEYPEICNDVVIYPSSVIVGDIKVDDCAIIGASSLVLCNVCPRSIYAGVPAKRLDK